MAITSCVKQGMLRQLDDSISNDPRGENMVNQDTQMIAPEDGVVVVCLKSEFSAYVVPPGGVITGVSGSLIIVD